MNSPPYPGKIWNRAATELRAPSPTSTQVAPPLEMTDGPAGGGGLSLHSAPTASIGALSSAAARYGTEADYADNRYWVALAFVSNDQTQGPTAPCFRHRVCLQRPAI